MQRKAFDFIVTGEVIGQRPMSQRRDTMPVVARESGADDLLLRPLVRTQPAADPARSAKAGSTATGCMRFNGRIAQTADGAGRKIRLSRLRAAGRRLLFSDRRAVFVKLADLWKTRGERRYELDDIMLLKVGRHLRPRPHFKMIVGREEGENRFLEGYRKQFTHLLPVSHKGPLVLVDGAPTEEDLELAARLTARFSQGRDADRVEVQYQAPDGAARTLSVAPIAGDAIPGDWYL